MCINLSGIQMITSAYSVEGIYTSVYLPFYNNNNLRFC